MGKKATGRIYRTVNFYSISKELKLQILRLKMLYLVVREGLKVQTHLAACCCNTFAATSENLLWKSLSPWQNFFATTSLTNSDWFDFMQRVAGTKFLVETKIFTRTPQYTWSNFLLQHVTANWGSDLSSLCVALTCQLECSDLKPITANCESRALRALQC